MRFGLLHDPKLLFIMALAGVVAMLTTLPVAARPAAVRTRRVALAFTVSQLFFMLTRFGNLFYLPLLARYVDRATKTGHTELLYGQIQWIITGAAAGAFIAWALLPTFVEVYSRAIRSMEFRQSMPRVLLRLAKASGWAQLKASMRMPSLLGVQLGALEGIPVDFLIVNILATAIWTVGALCAVYVSATSPQYDATALLLSGLVNSFAAISFTIFVDPKAALITDQAVKDERPARHVDIVAVHLAAGNFIGSLLGLAMLSPGVALITAATTWIGASGGTLVSSLWIVVAINLVVTLLASTATVSRVSAVVTGRVATALAVYNLFYLVTRLAQQVYAPLLGAMRDQVVKMHGTDVGALSGMYHWIIFGALGGAIIGWLMMPTFVEIYTGAIRGLDKTGSMPALLLSLLKPSMWPRLIACIRPPSVFGVTMADVKSIPRGFLWGNILVIAIQTIGVMAAIYAGALDQGLSRTATLLSSVVNGVATITLSLIVDPMSALITDECVHQKRPERHIYIMAVFLIGGTAIGTLLSQAIFDPAAHIILAGARLLSRIF